MRTGASLAIWRHDLIAIDFTKSYKGDQLYVMHCHNLEHEDQGMMVNHLVKAM